jgi:hypothetical protein
MPLLELRLHYMQLSYIFTNTLTACEHVQTLTMTVDGEPWGQPACTIVVKRQPQALMLRPASQSKVDATLKLEFNDKVVNAAHRKGIISAEQARQLSAEAVLHASSKNPAGSPKLRLD